MNKYYAYARVSTKEQSDTSIENQLGFLKKRAKELNLIYVEMHEKKSGKNIEDRTVFKQILFNISKDDILGVFDQSRLSRDESESLGLISTLEKKGAILEIGGRKLDSNNYTDLLNFNILSSINAYFRRVQNDKSKQSIKLVKEKGDWIFTSRLYGYKIDITAPKGSKVTIIDEEANIISYIFNSYAEGLSINKICTNLTLQGKKTRIGNKSKKAHTFHAATVRRYILKPIYMGFYIKDSSTNKRGFDRVDIKEGELVKSTEYPAIIEPSLWWKVYTSYRQVDRTHARQFKYRWSGYKLSSVIKCSYCESTYVHGIHKSNTGKVNSNYVCRIHSKDCPQTTHTFRESVLNELFDIIFFFYYYHLSDVIDYEVKISEEYKMLTDEQQFELKSIELNMEEINKKQQRLLLLRLESDDFPEELLLTQQQNLKTELDRYKLNKNDLTEVIENRYEDYYDKRTDDIADEYNYYLSESIQGQRGILLNLLKATVGDKVINIEYNNGNSLNIELVKNRGRTIQKAFHITYTREHRDYKQEPVSLEYRTSLQFKVDLESKTIKVLPPPYKNKNKEINKRYVESYYSNSINKIKDLLSKTNEYYKAYKII